MSSPDHSPPNLLKWLHGGHAFLRELAKRVVTRALTLREREVRRLNRLPQRALVLLGRLAHDAARAEAPTVLVVAFVPAGSVGHDHLPDHAHGGDGVREPLELSDVLEQPV